MHRPRPSPSSTGRLAPASGLTPPGSQPLGPPSRERSSVVKFTRETRFTVARQKMGRRRDQTWRSWSVFLENRVRHKPSMAKQWFQAVDLGLCFCPTFCGQAKFAEARACRVRWWPPAKSRPFTTFPLSRGQSGRGRRKWSCLKDQHALKKWERVPLHFYSSFSSNSFSMSATRRYSKY